MTLVMSLVMVGKPGRLDIPDAVRGVRRRMLWKRAAVQAGLSAGVMGAWVELDAVGRVRGGRHE